MRQKMTGSVSMRAGLTFILAAMLLSGLAFLSAGMDKDAGTDSPTGFLVNVNESADEESQVNEGAGEGDTTDTTEPEGSRDEIDIAPDAVAERDDSLTLEDVMNNKEEYAGNTYTFDGHKVHVDESSQKLVTTGDYKYDNGQRKVFNGDEWVDNDPGETFKDNKERTATIDPDGEFIYYQEKRGEGEGGIWKDSEGNERKTMTITEERKDEGNVDVTIYLGNDERMLAEDKDGNLREVKNFEDGEIKEYEEGTVEGNVFGESCSEGGCVAGECVGGVCRTNSGAATYNMHKHNLNSRIYGAYQWGGYSKAVSSLLFEDGAFSEWRKRMDQFFATEVLGMSLGNLFGGNWEDSVCHLDFDIDGDQTVMIDAGTDMTEYGMHVEGEKSESLEYVNESGANVTEYLYKISLYVVNTNDDENRFNLKFVRDDGKIVYYFNRGRNLTAGGAYDGTGQNMIVDYSENDYVSVCLELEYPIEDYEENEEWQVCNTLTTYKGGPTSVVEKKQEGFKTNTEGEIYNDDW